LSELESILGAICLAHLIARLVEARKLWSLKPQTISALSRCRRLWGWGFEGLSALAMALMALTSLGSPTDGQGAQMIWLFLALAGVQLWRFVLINVSDSLSFWAENGVFRQQGWCHSLFLGPKNPVALTRLADLIIFMLIFEATIIGPLFICLLSVVYLHGPSAGGWPNSLGSRGPGQVKALQWHSA
jgi:hypothetical protein